MNLPRRIPAPVQPIIEEYIGLTNKQLPSMIGGFYIVGSIALGEFNERFSDIDFLAILNRGATAEEIKQLRRIHHVLEKNRPRWKMSGSYIQPEDLGKPEGEIAPHPHYHNGVLYPKHSSELNLVTWWEFKNHGIAVVGAKPQELLFIVDWQELILRMQENMNSYWASWANQPGRILRLYSNWGIQWAVLGILRQFYTFRENSITTKVRAARYALGCLPVRWHKLIQEAVHIRQGNRESAYRFRIARMIEAANFLKYIIQLCNISYPPK